MMSQDEKTNYMRLQELKFEVGKLIVNWRLDGRAVRERTGRIYIALADELENVLKAFEKKQYQINYEEVK